MFSLTRTAFTLPARAFSTSTKAAHDMARLTLIGRIAKEAEVRTTKAEKEYVAYTIATRKYPAPRDSEESTATFHRILSFQAHQNAYLTRLPKGSLVHVEAEYEVKEPDPSAEAGSYAAQRQIFLRHENIRVLQGPKPRPEASEHQETEEPAESH